MRLDAASAGGIGRAALAAGLGLVLGAGLAPPLSAPEADSDGPIVVTGTLLSPDEVRRRAVEFVRGTGVASGQTPAARWAEPVCPRVLGLGTEQARVVEAKMRAIARAAGIAAARAPCRANIAVSFAADAGEVVRTVDRRSPRRLAEVPAAARQALLEGPAPIRWWYVTDTRSRHGMRGRGNPAVFAQGDGDSHSEGGGSMLSAGVPSIQHYDSSKISTQAHRVLTSATVVVDAGGVKGMPLDAVASYAAFVAFAEIRALDFTPPGSILGLFQGPSASQELTEQDLAFLRALYRLQLDRGARHHRGTIVRELIDAQKTGG
jgi:hypothetical protein